MVETQAHVPKRLGALGRKHAAMSQGYTTQAISTKQYIKIETTAKYHRPFSLDFSKSFNTINHKILIEYVRFYHFTPSAVKIIASFLEKKKSIRKNSRKQLQNAKTFYRCASGFSYWTFTAFNLIIQMICFQSQTILRYSSV